MTVKIFRSTTRSFHFFRVNLLFAAQAGDITALRRYHLADLNMDSTDYDGRTALHLAASEGHDHCVDYLIKVCKVSPHVSFFLSEQFAKKFVFIFSVERSMGSHAIR